MFFCLRTNPLISVQDVITSQDAWWGLEDTSMASFCLNSRKFWVWFRLLPLLITLIYLNLWKWDAKKQFTICSLYCFLGFRWVLVSNAMLWWQNSVLHKVKLFMWWTFKNKIRTKNVLKKKRWQGDINCQFCMNNEETINSSYFP